MGNIKDDIIIILEILQTADYADPAEYLYDGIKVISRHIRLNDTITIGHLQDFMWCLDNTIVYDFDGKLCECITLLNICIRNYTILSILD